MSGPDSLFAPAVIPILPAVQSLLVVVTLCASGLVAGLWAMRHPRSWGLLLRVLWSQKWSLLSLGVIVVAGAALIQRVNGRAEESTTGATAVDDVWMARGGPQRPGSISGARPPADQAVRWTGGIGHTFFASPAVAGRCVYNIGFRGDRSRVFCWDIRDGQQLWTGAIPGMRATFSSPVIQRQQLIVGEGLHHTPDSRVFVLDLTPGYEGHVRWSFTTGSHVECTPVIADGLVYVTAGEDGVYALRWVDAPHTDSSIVENPIDRVQWHVPGSLVPDVETALCHHQGRLYVGTGRGGQALVALDAMTGEEIGRIEMPFPVHGLPAQCGNRLYVGMGNADYVNSHEPLGQVACIDLESFAVRWTFPTPGTVLGAVVCDRDGVVFGDTSGRVHLLDAADGQPLAEWNGRSPVLASVAVVDETVFVVNASGFLSALDRHKLEPLWEARLGAPGLYVSSPVVADGCVCVGTPADGFVCIGSRTAAPRTAVVGTLPPKGQVLWQTSLAGRIVAPPGVTGSMMIVPAVTNEGPRLTGLELSATEAAEVAWDIATDAPAATGIVTTGEIALVTTETELIAIDAPTGAVLWRVPADIDEPPVVEQGTIWIRSTSGPNEQWRLRDLSSGQTIRPTTGDAPRDTRSAGHWQIEKGILRRIPPGADSGHTWCDLTRLGEIVLPPVISGNRVYVVLNGQRVVALGRAEEE